MTRERLRGSTINAPLKQAEVVVHDIVFQRSSNIGIISQIHERLHLQDCRQNYVCQSAEDGHFNETAQRMWITNPHPKLGTVINICIYIYICIVIRENGAFRSLLVRKNSYILQTSILSFRWLTTFSNLLKIVININKPVIKHIN